ncbi:carbamoyltransferase HypF [Chloroflexota bacterium]
MAQAVDTLTALRISVHGVVQGVGFRPFVYQLAQEYDLKGWVCNTSGDVAIEVEGKSTHLTRFLDRLKKTPPPQAHIDDISVSGQPVTGYEQFEIRHSLDREGEYQLISPDLATCDACKAEIFDPANRRYRYPFTNCTNCGPRFTIIEDIPYDRTQTTMRHFQMCPDCQREYDDPLDRRFHAQPNACPSCGPSLQLADAAGNTVPSHDIMADASRLLREGNILAIKGLGGFLLACDATSDQAVYRLRERKRRPAKPLAVMSSNLKEVKGHCRVSSQEEALLTSSQSPIVLLRWKPTSSISAAVAPGLKYLGVMLPYTPLHHLLLRETNLPLVMTSGNLTEEPIAKDNDEALRRLHGIADYYLMHNRDIYSRYDDSVIMVEGEKPVMLRRARSYAPYPIHLPFSARKVLACGAELKNTFCLTRDNHAFLGQHIGDMENLETMEHFETTVSLYERLFRIQPELIACDMHPDYLVTKWAQEVSEHSQIPLISVQHHHAHIVSCMIDNKVQEPVIGVSCDGTGYGADGHIWGGEFLVADYRHYQRKAHLEYLPLPGGTAAINRPYRTAIGYLYALLGKKAFSPELPCFKDVDEVELDLIQRQIDRGINTPLTSSCGRLFDAVSSLLGIRRQIDYEGQAAVELEMAADEELVAGAYPFTIETKDDVSIIRLRELFAAIISDLAKGIPTSAISARFHHTVAQIVSEVCSRLTRETGITRVALSGGVFQNRLLLRRAVEALEAAGLTPITHSQVPGNDGGISLGQAVIANFASQGS